MVKKEPKFVRSKWEEVDPEKLEKQAITTSKWDFFDADDAKDGNNNEDEKPISRAAANLTSYGTDDDTSQEAQLTG